MRERQVRAESLSHLRRRLTLWYAGTFSLILIVLGWGLFIVIRAQFSRDLAASLRENTDRVRQRLVAGQVTPGSPFASTPPAANVDSEATLYLFTADGRAIEPPQAESWIRDAALHAARAGKVDREHDAENEVTFFLHAERVDLPNGDRYVAAAVRKDVEFEDRYSALIAAFISAAVIALVLLAGGGWFLVRQSTSPVEASIEQMRRFVADAAHELRTPLTILRSRTEVALQQPREASSYQQTLRGIESDARHLGGIVEDLFTLARADAGERPRVSQRLSLDDIALDAAQAARVVAQAKGVTLDVMEFEEARADGDPALLRQLFMILLDNAVKFTEAGGRVTMRVGSDAGHATVSVEDTGIGIPAEHVPRIFDRFYRTDVARTPGQMADGGRAGAGLGLSIARWIADVHAAHMSVDSRPGVGTRMTVRFPATTSS